MAYLYMPKDIHDIASAIKKLYSRRIQPLFYLYKTYFVISVFLGVVLEFKLSDGMSDKSVQLINHSVQLINYSVNTSSSNPIDHSLVFSTSAAILSTVFTIIFVLLTVFIQMSGEYTSADILYNTETSLLLRLYFGTIVLSLMMLETTFQFPILVLTLTFACILSLYPFLYNLSNKLMYGVGVKELSEKISSLINSNEEDLAINKIYLLTNICKRSVTDNRQQMFQNILYNLYKNSLKAKDKKMENAIIVFGVGYLDILNSLIAENPTASRENITTNDDTLRLLDYIKLYAENYSEMIPCIYLNYQQALALKEAGIKMINSGFEDNTVNQIVEILFCTFKSLQKKRELDNCEAENSIEKVEIDIVQYIGVLMVELHQVNFKLSFNTSMIKLFEIGAKVLQARDIAEPSNSSKLLNVIVKQLYEIEHITSTVEFDNRYKNLRQYIVTEPELEKHWDSFKEYYDKQKIVSQLVYEGTQFT